MVMNSNKTQIENEAEGDKTEESDELVESYYQYVKTSYHFKETVA